MLEHPDITHVNLTGYTQDQMESLTDEICTNCLDEPADTAFAVKYDDAYFCHTGCLVDWLFRVGFAEWAESDR